MVLWQGEYDVPANVLEHEPRYKQSLIILNTVYLDIENMLILSLRTIARKVKTS